MNKYLYQKANLYFGQLASGTEQVGRNELKKLGAKEIKAGFRGFHFSADKETLYKIVYQSRIFSRFLAPLIVFDCHSEKYLYKTAQNIDWSDFLTLTKTLAITSNVADSNIRNSQYAARVLKDAIVDQFRENTGERPNIDVHNPDLQLNLYIHRNKAHISVDLGGGSLHKRGYRTESVDAPMQETLAATIIRLTDWNGKQPLYDPFCGSGTILCEAHMQLHKIPPAYLRPKFGFLRLPDFDATVWNQVKTKANKAITGEFPGLIKGSDIDPAALKTVRTNRNNLPNGDEIKVRRSDFHDLEGFNNTTIITNPPYGIRLSNPHEVELLLKEFGDFLKQKCTGSTAYIYYGEQKLIKKLGLKPAWKHPLRNGGLDGVLCKYELY